MTCSRQFVRHRAARSSTWRRSLALPLAAMVPLAPVFDDPRYWLAVGGGVLVG